MKLPWKNATAAPDVSPLGPSPLRGLAVLHRQGCPAGLWGHRQHCCCCLWRWGEVTPLLQARARSLLLQRFFLPQSPLQEASLMWRCDAAWRQHMPPPLLRTPALTTTGLPRGLLFSLESPTLGYLHPFLRERQEVVWIRAIYSYLHLSPSQAPCALMKIPTAGLTHCTPLRQGPEAPQSVPALLGWQVGTRNPRCPGGRGPFGSPALLAVASISHRGKSGAVLTQAPAGSRERTGPWASLWHPCNCSRNPNPGQAGVCAAGREDADGALHSKRAGSVES